MAKKIKPGQMYVLPGGIYLRAKKRTNGCNGCIFKDITICPNAKIKNSTMPPSNCEENQIIFVKF